MNRLGGPQQNGAHRDVAARSRLEQLSQQSRESQRAVEAADTMPFDVYLQEYLSPRRLVAGKGN